MPTIPILIIVFGLLLLVFWITQFISMMNMDDSDFNGRYDKLIWASVLIFLNIFGAIVFWIWDSARMKRIEAEQDVVKVFRQATATKK
ncbi:MAG: PLDc N-terminal domain-containing protein [Phycisphaeraceae bacterium]|nr:PLDc N-terminal domain-containing protein [Phycisphaeraceae bacterium]